MRRAPEAAHATALRGALAGDLQEHLLHRRLVERRAAEDAPRHLERRALGDDAAAVEEDDAIAHLLDLGHVVRGVEDREAARAPDVVEQRARVFSAMSGSRLDVGSSRTSRSGSWRSARASPARVCWPSDRSPKRDAARARSSSMVDRASRSRRAARRRARRRRAGSRATLRRQSMSASGDAKPTRRSAVFEPSWGSWPNSRTVPAVGRTTPRSMCSVVVLPAPFGPRSPSTSPRRTSNETPSRAMAPRKRFPRSRTCTGRVGRRTPSPCVYGGSRPVNAGQLDDRSAGDDQRAAHEARRNEPLAVERERPRLAREAGRRPPTARATPRTRRASGRPRRTR